VKFREIEDGDKVHPGEYLLHTPSNQIVICGAFLKDQNKIKVLAEGRLMTDSIDNFNKIVLNPNERKQRRVYKCKGCSRTR
jgi:hypothetical protein